MSKQTQVLRIQTFFSTKKRATVKNPTGWTTHYEQDTYLFSPTHAQIEQAIEINARKIAYNYGYCERGELDRKLVCRAFYPEIHDNSTELAYFGESVAEYDFANNKIVWSE